MRFDEIELQAVTVGIEDVAHAAADAAPLGKRALALLTDLSLFAALAMALTPLLPEKHTGLQIAALSGFVVVLSYYYFVGTWMLWGKTIGGVIFDVRVSPSADGVMSLRDASVRWASLFLSFATAGIGFFLAALPSRQSLPDRLSNTRCTAG